MRPGARAVVLAVLRHRGPLWIELAVTAAVLLVLLWFDGSWVAALMAIFVIPAVVVRHDEP